MGLSVLRSLLTNIKECSSAWYAIIADEATNVANREQLNLSIRWVSNDYEVSEDPAGLYCLPNTTSDTLYTVVTDILTPVHSSTFTACVEGRHLMGLPTCMSCH